MASSSSSSTRHWKYDVFLSFRGPDTRKAIAVELHDRLNRSGIKTFMDNPDLQVGDSLSPTLIKAIQDSRFAIVVLSQNYAFSTWCLEELGEICLSMKDYRIFPLFYEVDPTVVRYQKEIFKYAFSNLKTCGRHEPKKVKQWKADLHRVANISGWNTNKYNTNKDLVDDIVECLRSKVPLEASTRYWKYDVFVSFRGLDTRKAISGELHHRLNRSGIKMFMGNLDLQVGDNISPTLIKAIQDSRFAIVVLSQNYASSTWCLEELREICLSTEDNRILPVFYEVEPSDVRYQMRKFGEAFCNHEYRYEPEKVKQWRDDLRRVANIAGWKTEDRKTYGDLIDDIVEYLLKKVPLDAIEFTKHFPENEATNTRPNGASDDGHSPSSEAI